MKKPCFLLLLWLTGCVAALAQPNRTGGPAARPNAARPNAARPQTDSHLSAQFDKLLSEQFKPGESGCTALVARKGQMIYQKAFGLAHIELNVPMQPDNVFRIGSITKQFTAIAILQLMEQGKLSLQDEITRFLPDYPTQGKKITIEHLLTHTSGIKSYTDMKEFGGIMQKDMPPTELIDFFKNQPMDFEPSTKWSYCNSGCFLLGYIVEKVSGKTYPQYVEEVFFKPLGMTNSCYGSNARIIKNRAAGYQPGQNESVQNADNMSMTLPYAAGSIQSTVSDLWTWHQAVHSYKLVKKETLDRAFTAYKLSDGKPTDYGYGWALATLQGSATIEHNGSINGFLTNSIYLPQEDVFVAVFSNSTGKASDPVAQRIAALAIGKPFVPRVAVQVDEKILETYVGDYELAPDFILSITKDQNRLMSQATGQGKAELFAETETKFFPKDFEAQIEFVKDDSAPAGRGKVTKLILLQGGRKTEAKKIK